MHISPEATAQRIEHIFSRFKGEREELIPILQTVQEIFGYLPEDVLKEVARFTSVAESRVYGTATFYAQFRLAPVGRVNLMVCEGTACYVNGAETLTRTISDELHIAIGETTEDGLFTMERVACVGCCSLAPVIVVDGEAHANMTPARVRRLIGRLREKEQSPIGALEKEAL